MTPTARQRWVRQALQIIRESHAELSDAVEAIGRAIEKIPSPSDRRALVTLTKRALRLRTRQITATVRVGTDLPEAIGERLESYARANGARIIEQQTDSKLLAGFQIQIGDDRSDRTLLNKLKQF